MDFIEGSNLRPILYLMRGLAFLICSPYGDLVLNDFAPRDGHLAFGSLDNPVQALAPIKVIATVASESVLVES